MRKHIIPIFALLTLNCSLTACSGFFEKDNIPTPTPLSNIHAEFTPQRVWTQRIGGAIGKDNRSFAPVIKNNIIYISNPDGTVAALHQRDGSVLWRTNTGHNLSTSPGVAGDLLAVVSSQGDLITLDAKSGAINW